MRFADRLKHGWNAFRNRDPTDQDSQDTGSGSYNRPDRTRLRGSHERSILNSVLTRIAIDVASISIRHVRLNEKGNFTDIIKSGLNNALSVETNIDQAARAFIQDVVMSLFDEGAVAVVPIDATFSSKAPGSFDIQTMRSAKILEWFPQHVRLRVYNDQTGLHQEIKISKKRVAIIENPLYSVMNEPNSTLQRLIRKLNMLDAIDEQSSSGKLDIIIKLPYAVRTEQRRQQAELRRNELEKQLSGSKYGIGYIDAADQIIQLNRAAENQLLQQVEYLTKTFYSQIGMTEKIFNGDASEQEMLNYTARTLEPIISAIVDEFVRKFLTKTARSQNQTIMFFQDPFRLIPKNELANIADKFTRNEILSSNEVRAMIGKEPSSDPAADELRNKNLNQSDGGKTPNSTSEKVDETGIK